MCWGLRSGGGGGEGGGGGGQEVRERKKLVLGLCFQVFVLCFFENPPLLFAIINCSCVPTKTSLSGVFFFFFLRFCCDGCENEVRSQQWENSRL